MSMASPSERSSSSRSTTSLMPGRIVVACDATRNFNAHEFKQIITNIQMRQNMIQEVDTITVLGVLHKVLHPSKSICIELCAILRMFGLSYCKPSLSRIFVVKIVCSVCN